MSFIKNMIAASVLLFFSNTLYADDVAIKEKTAATTVETELHQADANEAKPEQEKKKKKKGKFTLGGYGEVVYTRNFYSDKYLRYTDAETYKNDKSHGRFDLPHVVLWLGYDFGKGWSVGTEIEFEHGGSGTTVEIEEEEGGEYEKEVEKGGEVALEQFWIQKSFNRAANLKLGHIIVPVGMTNNNHTPDQFFTNYRPEGENTIIPCTWHETGISFWGRVKDWRYEVMFLAGLDADRFGSKNWVKGGSGSPYEFKIANSYAGAFRVDNFSVKNLRLSLSGYVGNSFKNSLSATDNSKYKDVHGTVAIGAFDFCYNNQRFILRGNFDYGYLSDSEMITKYNMSMRKDSPSPKQGIAESAIAGGIEGGYDMFSMSRKLNERGHRLFLFGRYEYYDSMFTTQGTVRDLEWCGRHRIAAGLNYWPNKNIVIKGEYSHRFLKSQYNNEPSVSIGVAYTGVFIK